VRAELAALTIADPPERWQALGFAVDADRVVLGGVTLVLGGGGTGITAWTLRHAGPGDAIDGLATAWTAERPRTGVGAHPNGALAVDHVVIATPQFDRTAVALAQRGLELRRTRQAGDRRQGFRRLGPTIMEVVEAPEAREPCFWGLTIVVSDLSALGPLLSAHVGPARPAVQPGRHIATLQSGAGLSTRVAFMDPE